MKRFLAGIVGIDQCLYVISGSVLACLIVLTLCDVVLRNLGRPITGSMEIIQYGGCIVFGFAVPYATRLKAQVMVDIVTEKLGPGKKRIVGIATRGLGIVIFLFIAYNFVLYGLDVIRSGERTASFKIPYYPFAFALAFAFLMQGLTIVTDLIQTWKGEGRE